MGKGENMLASTLFTYTLTHLANKDKVRFYYALKGRDGKGGVIEQYKIEQLAKGVLLVTRKQEEEVEEFLKYWKCKYTKRKVQLEQ
tara:strand:- start:54334 stop:54591 length:258 start_codon:yes stop_codon:yes gene_type:complete